MLMLMVGMSALQLVLSTSMIICTSSPGAYPSFSKWIDVAVMPLLMQQHDVISAFDFFNCEATILVSRRVISRPYFSWNCLVVGSMATVM